LPVDDICNIGEVEVLSIYMQSADTWFSDKKYEIIAHRTGHNI
jgi:uncharacterized protein YerC